LKACLTPRDRLYSASYLRKYRRDGVTIIRPGAAQRAACGHKDARGKPIRLNRAANDDLAFAIGRKKMFIAMNRFRVKRGAEGAFENVWLSRDSYLDRVPGFVEFHLLKGPDAKDHTLYASHTVWQSKAAFEAWTKSEEFRAAHARAGNDATGPLYLEHPKFEGFEVRQTITRKAAVA
jgi:heme-degrading monooxygenase HmoA